MTLIELNNFPSDAARSELFRCCGASRWVETMEKRRPYKSTDELLRVADEVWQQLTPADWKEAFSHHPKIGDIDSLRQKFAATANWAAGEQSGVATATEEIIQSLAEGNRAYEEKFGYIFIVCATGKSAAEMLTLLNERLKNNSDDEIRIAAGEQAKITGLRLTKLLNSIATK